MVPSLILQPLVENAIKYGLGRAERGVTLALTAGRVDGRLVLTVEDSGADAEARLPEPGFGIGLSNVRQRLAALYGEHGGLEAGPTEDGWRSVVSLPWEPER
jgi:LytS/YehU family sensor histidine kinase